MFKNLFVFACVMALSAAVPEPKPELVYSVGYAPPAYSAAYTAPAYGAAYAAPYTYASASGLAAYTGYYPSAYSFFYRR